MIAKETYIKLKFGAFGYEGDIQYLDKAIEQTLRLREQVDLTEPEDIAQVYQ